MSAGSIEPRLPNLDGCTRARDACAALALLGWQECGRGDWSWVLRDPSDSIAARITPWDAAYLMHGRMCIQHAHNPYLQRILRIQPLGRVGHAIFMERLHAADEARAAELVTALDLVSGVDSKQRSTAAHRTGDTPQLHELRTLLLAAEHQGRITLPFWGGFDVSTKNIMATGDGQLRLIDPYFVSGLAIVSALQNGETDRLRALSADELRAFLQIPVFADTEETAALRRVVDGMYPTHER